MHTLNGVRLAGVCHSVREDETVLTVYEVFDSVEHAFVKEVLLRGPLVEYPWERELVCVFSRPVYAVLVRVGGLRRVGKESVSW